MGQIIDKVKGKAKEVGGVITDDERMKREGRRDQMKGAVKGAVEKVADKTHRAIDDAKRKIDRI